MPISCQGRVARSLASKTASRQRLYPLDFTKSRQTVHRTIVRGVRNGCGPCHCPSIRRCITLRMRRMRQANQPRASGPSLVPLALRFPASALWPSPATLAGWAFPMGVSISTPRRNAGLGGLGRAGLGGSISGAMFFRHFDQSLDGVLWPQEGAVREAIRAKAVKGSPSTKGCVNCLRLTPEAGGKLVRGHASLLAQVRGRSWRALCRRRAQKKRLSRDSADRGSPLKAHLIFGGELPPAFRRCRIRPN